MVGSETHRIVHNLSQRKTTKQHCSAAKTSPAGRKVNLEKESLKYFGNRALEKGYKVWRICSSFFSMHEAKHNITT